MDVYCANKNLICTFYIEKKTTKKTNQTNYYVRSFNTSKKLRFISSPSYKLHFVLLSGSQPEVRVPLVVRQGVPGGTRVISRWCLFTVKKSLHGAIEEILDQGLSKALTLNWVENFFLVMNRIRGQNLNGSHSSAAFGVTN